MPLECFHITGDYKIVPTQWAPDEDNPDRSSHQVINAISQQYCHVKPLILLAIDLGCPLRTQSLRNGGHGSAKFSKGHLIFVVVHHLNVIRLFDKTLIRLWQRKILVLGNFDRGSASPKDIRSGAAVICAGQGLTYWTTREAAEYISSRRTRPGPVQATIWSAST